MFDNLIKNNRDSYFKKYFFEILKSRYSKNEKIIERVLYFLTDSDLKEFGSLIADIYEVSYLQCIEDHKKSLESMGYKVNISATPHNYSNDGVMSEGTHS